MNYYEIEYQSFTIISYLEFQEKIWLYHRKELMPFSLKFQRNNQQNVLTMDSAKGKTGEKGSMFTALWR